jgi:hypothetical protein
MTRRSGKLMQLTMNAICLVIDRLHSGYLGAYGNGWIETPAFDRLAAESFLFDNLLIDTPELETLYRSYWQGWHALSAPPPQDRPALAAILREAGVHTALLTDDRTVREHPLAVDFDDVIQVDPPWQFQMAAEGHFEQTHLARCFVQIIDSMQAAPQPYLLWCHLASLGLTWDAPPEFRRGYWQENDPEPSLSADVPDRLLPDDHDPDEVLVASQAYAGQVSLWDTCLGGLWEALREHPTGRETLLLLTSPRGFPLGEHRRIGPCDEALYSELVQVPLAIRFPDGLEATARSQALVEPADLRATLLDYWRIADSLSSPSSASLMPIIREEVRAVRDRLVIVGRDGERAIRTPAWHLRAAEVSELYVKPDDRWEVNNVTSRCQEVVECLQDTLMQSEQTLRSGRISDLPPLSEALAQGLD